MEVFPALTRYLIVQKHIYLNHACKFPFPFYVNAFSIQKTIIVLGCKKFSSPFTTMSFKFLKKIKITSADSSRTIHKIT